MRLDDEFIASWNAADVDRTVAIMAPNGVWRDINSPQPMDISGARAYAKAWYVAFPDLKATVRRRIVTADEVATEVEFTATNTGPLQMGPGPAIPATGKTVHGQGAYFLRVANGKVVEISTHPDVAGMMMQMGLMGG